MTRRTQRVGESMREVISELIQRQVKDPRIGFVTITAVHVTPDLSKAHVYYTVLGDEDAQEATRKGLESASPFLRSETGRRIRLKTLPELHFHFDEAPDHGARVDALLGEIHRHREPPTELPPVAPELDAALDAAARVLKEAEEVAIVCHVGPDGDALGSLLAAALTLDAQGVRVVPSWPEGIEFPAQYAFLPGQDLLVPPEEFEANDVVLAVDCASADRLDELQHKVEAARAIVNVDHHVSNTRFGTVDVVDDRAASSAELVLRLLLKLGAEITPEVATCLYTGLVTDTGRFSYASVRPGTHVVAAYLIEHGVPVDEISQALFEALPYGYLKILGRVLERCRFLDDPPLVVSYLTQADLAEAGVTLDETEEIINVLRSTRGADAAAVLKELEDGDWKGSLRSKGDTDVSLVARHFDGGGHRLAAGFTSTLGLEETIEAIHRILREGVTDAGP